MAEGRRREDEDDELRERRELGAPRRARGRVLSGHPAAGEGLGQREGRDGGAGDPGPRTPCSGRRRLPRPRGGDPHLQLWEASRRESGFPSIPILTLGPSPRKFKIISTC